ncbi:GAK system XXXCH domain-containing protein [Desulfovibrio mangrovi]|uniref:GAK system XXXCH domain-containing protein n=1 Tax=Desulfovibrio mangrovi TaxID=2976983 RepID=UPI00224715C7|nr:GAK system XXXCH domain-containing protein [Desulfovibrio mangrovi]UZP67110.1 GAK system XXXCH domain-containing protein [Desulfovibrio mangrovi]
MSRKFVLECTRDELPALFRDIADALEGKQTGSTQLPSLESFRKLQIGVKDEYGLVSLKLKFRDDHGNLDLSGDSEPAATLEHAPQTGEEQHPQPYSNLKHELQASFKAIYRAVHTGKLPPAEAVQAFEAQSRLMTRYDDCGSEYYAPYNAALDEFMAAWKAQDITAMHDAVDAINHVKTDCHQRYK